MTKTKIIAIDGPAGSGKSTVAKELAQKLGFLYVDTGAMYRALTLKAMRKGVSFDDKKALIELSRDMDIESIQTKDVSDKIRTMDVTKNVKFVASVKGVRDNMVKLQRKLGAAGFGAVLEGRDIGTVVFPDASHKFYLDASLETRVKRRYDELIAKGAAASREDVENDVKSRDASDMTRKEGPLLKARDAITVDTTGMTVEQVVKKISDLIL